MRVVKTTNFWWGVAAAVVGLWAWQRFAMPMMASKSSGS